ncbi:hypothetical protein ACFL2R_01690 [Patescibacteria group bacterium]
MGEVTLKNPFEDSKAIQAREIILRESLSLSNDSRQACGMPTETSKINDDFGVLIPNPAGMFREQAIPFTFELLKRTVRRPKICIGILKTTASSTKKLRWTFNVFGEKRMELATRLAHMIVAQIDVDVEVVLDSTEERFETFYCDE